MPASTSLDEASCYRAVRSKDVRFDGIFYSGVTSTGIYCRPSCPAITPKRQNLRYYRTAAAAQEAGFRACKRCRPEAAPGSPEWNVREDVAARAMRLIADGAVDRDGVTGLAQTLGYSERQLHRLLVDEVGAPPLALARAQRARTARVLCETTTMPMTDIAFAAGFASVRQFNDTVKQVFDASPTQLRRANSSRSISDPASVSLQLAYREPMDVRGILDFLGHRCVDGIEEYVAGKFTRSMTLPYGNAVVRVSKSAGESTKPGIGFVDCALWLDDLRDLTAAVSRTRRMLDLDADPTAIDDHLREDRLLRPLVDAAPGLRVPGSPNPDESAIRIVIGQQVSTSGARTVAGRLVAACGSELKNPIGSVTHTFPTMDVLADIDHKHLSMPVARKHAISSLAQAVTSGRVTLGPGTEWDQAAGELLTIKGIGPWTVAALRMRGLGDPDVLLAGDLGVSKAMEKLGGSGKAIDIERRAQDWRPWRSYTTHHLWAYLDRQATQTKTTKKVPKKGRAS